jgi:hypothetical protein
MVPSLEAAHGGEALETRKKARILALELMIGF